MPVSPDFNEALEELLAQHRDDDTAVLGMLKTMTQLRDILDMREVPSILSEASVRMVTSQTGMAQAVLGIQQLDELRGLREDVRVHSTRQLTALTAIAAGIDRLAEAWCVEPETSIVDGVAATDEHESASTVGDWQQDAVAEPREYEEYDTMAESDHEHAESVEDALAEPVIADDVVTDTESETEQPAESEADVDVEHSDIDADTSDAAEAAESEDDVVEEQHLDVEVIEASLAETAVPDDDDDDTDADDPAETEDADADPVEVAR